MRFARPDGGDAGLHPCNIHDSAYPVGGIMVSGDTPVIVGPDGPSLGGFVVPAAVIRADLWKLGQLRPGDTVRLTPVTPEAAARAASARHTELADAPQATALVEHASTHALPSPQPPRTPSPPTHASTHERPEPLLTIAATGGRPELVVRYSGDHHLLVEAGPPRLDLTVRARIHLLALELNRREPTSITESVEGVRSLLIAFDTADAPHTSDATPAARLVRQIESVWLALPDPRGIELDVREVTLPICFDDPDAHEAMRRYQRGVRPDAPWCPDNVEFIRRVNGLRSREEVFEIVRAASYLVIGLGDVYLGAPLAVPLDPAHRLVTTKYDPPRTWTPENAVGIGGVYLCVYGMEGPGGYQLVGRTVPVWRRPAPDEPGVRRTDPWLLRTFDVLRFEPVGHDELMTLRAEIAEGRRQLTMRRTTLDLGALPAPEAPLSASAQQFTERRTAAFAAERQRWAERG